MVDVDAAGNVLLAVHVQPGARRPGVVGRHGEALKVRVTAPPVDGKANQAVIALMASVLDVPASSVQVTAGALSRRKRLRITDVADPAALVARIDTLAGRADDAPGPG